MKFFAEADLKFSIEVENLKEHGTKDFSFVPIQSAVSLLQYLSLCSNKQQITEKPKSLNFGVSKISH